MGINHVRVTKSSSLASVLALCIILNGGCSIWSRRKIPPEYERFFQLPLDRQSKELKKYAIDKQIDIYLAGMADVHPPTFHLAYDIASNGRDAIPFLLKRLREERLESAQADLMYVFTVMHEFNYNLSHEREAIDLMKDLTTKMKNPAQKARGEGYLKQILEGQAANIDHAGKFTSMTCREGS